MALDPNKIRSKVKAMKAKHTTSFTDLYKIPTGKTTVRILPNKEDVYEDFTRAYAMHWIRASQGGKPFTVGCPRVIYGDDCEICDMISEAYGQAKDFGDEESMKALDSMRARRRFLVNGLILSGPDKDPNKPQLIDLPSSLNEAILNEVETLLDEDIVLYDMDEGFDIVISKEGTGMDTKYGVSRRTKPTSVDHGVLELATDFDTYLRQQGFRDGQYNKGLRMISETTGIATRENVLPASTTALLSGGSEEKPAPAKKTKQVDIEVAEEELEEEQVELADVEPDAEETVYDSDEIDVSDLDSLMDIVDSYDEEK